MSQLTNNNTTNETATDAPQLCNSCFEFFGFKHTNFLCSKCFKEKCKTDEKPAKLLTKPASEEATNLTETAPTSEASTPSGSRKATFEEEKVNIESKIAEVLAESAKPVEKESNKCPKCTKKVSLMGIKCRCGFTFCKAHRLPEDHDCEFDFKQAGQAKLNKDMPAVVASKLEKI